MDNREIEVRFFEIDEKAIVARLIELKARDQGEELIKEVIFCDKDRQWLVSMERRYLRLRQDKTGQHLTFKKLLELTASGTLEIEIEVDDWFKAIEFLTAIGFIVLREQEKKRHRFVLDSVEVDIVNWPGIPASLELEGKSEDNLKAVVAKLNLPWSEAVVRDTMWIIENKYKMPINSYRYFTFNKIG